MSGTQTVDNPQPAGDAIGDELTQSTISSIRWFSVGVLAANVICIGLLAYALLFRKPRLPAALPEGDSSAYAQQAARYILNLAEQVVGQLEDAIELRNPKFSTAAQKSASSAASSVSVSQAPANAAWPQATGARAMIASQQDSRAGSHFSARDPELQGKDKDGTPTGVGIGGSAYQPVAINAGLSTVSPTGASTEAAAAPVTETMAREGEAVGASSAQQTEVATEAPAPEPPVTSPLEDYNRCRTMELSDAESFFYAKYPEVTRVSCENLEKHSDPNATLTFREDARGNFLLLRHSGDYLLFPAFSCDQVASRKLLDGVFQYPLGNFPRLRLAQPALPLEIGGTFSIFDQKQRGVFERAG